MPLAIPLCNGLPQLLTRLFAAIPNHIRDYLPALSAEGNPNSGVVDFFEHKRPQPRGFQSRGRGILGIRGEESGPQRRKLSSFFSVRAKDALGLMR